MNSYEDFVKEIEAYTLDELELIYKTQKNLYTSEEMNIIKWKLEQRRSEVQSNPAGQVMNGYTKEEQEKIKEMLPEEIKCPKCEGPNHFSNEKCDFCGADLEKEKYYTLEYYENNDEESVGSNGGRYLASFLIPLIGFILGAILLSKDDDGEKAAGQNCIAFGILGVIFVWVLWWCLL